MDTDKRKNLRMLLFVVIEWIYVNYKFKPRMAGLAKRAFDSNCDVDERLFKLLIDKFEIDCICSGISPDALKVYEKTRKILVDELSLNSKVFKDTTFHESYLRFLSTL